MRQRSVAVSVDRKNEQRKLIAKITSAAITAVGILMLVYALMLGARASAPKPVSANATAVIHGSTGELQITVHIKPGFHVNANKPKMSYLVGTTFTPALTFGILYGKPKYDAPRMVALPGMSGAQPVYENVTHVRIPFRLAPRVSRLNSALHGIISYQACDAKSCYPPSAIGVQARLIAR